MSRCIGKRSAAHTWWLGTEHIHFPFFSSWRSCMIDRKTWKGGWFFSPSSDLLCFVSEDQGRYKMRQGVSCYTFEASLAAPTCRLVCRLRFCFCHRFPRQVYVQALFCSRAECCYDYLRDTLKCHLLILSFWSPGWKCWWKGKVTVKHFRSTPPLCWLWPDKDLCLHSIALSCVLLQKS